MQMNFVRAHVRKCQPKGGLRVIIVSSHRPIVEEGKVFYVVVLGVSSPCTRDPSEMAPLLIQRLFTVST
jgi:hypothetical protein